MKLVLGSLFVSAITCNEITTFEQWLTKFERNYANDAERAHRRKIWEKNFELISTHNAAAEYGNGSIYGDIILLLERLLKTIVFHDPIFQVPTATGLV